MSHHPEVSGELHDVIRDAVTEEGALISARTKHLFRWWRDAGSGRPLRRDFDVLEHPKLMPYLYLYKVLSADSVEIRINGEIVADAFGHSWAGTVVQAQSKDPVHAVLARYLLDVAAAERPYRCLGSLSHVERGFVRFESIDCPLWGADGSVTHIVGCLDPTIGGQPGDCTG